MKIAIIGFGAIGKERYKALKQLSSEGLNLEKVIIYDPYIPIRLRSDDFVWADKLENIKELNPDWIFVCTPHDVAYTTLKTIIPWNTKILVEKPFCKTVKESIEIYDSLLYPKQLYVGFNYRFMDGISELIGDYNNNMFGDIISINMTLAHGGSSKDKTSWKMNPASVGNTCLLDPGIHLLDLLLFFEKDFIRPLCGKSWRGFWNTGIDEEVSLLLEDGKAIINLQVSLVKWASTFKIEVNGTEGYGIVQGRGKSYGNQVYRIGNRWHWEYSGKSQRDSEMIMKITDCNDSFYKELSSLLMGKEHYPPPCGSFSALDSMHLLDDCLAVIK